MFKLKVRCRTEVYDMDSISLNGKKLSGFLKPKKMPFSRKNR